MYSTIVYICDIHLSNTRINMLKVLQWGYERNVWAHRQNYVHLRLSLILEVDFIFTEAH